MLHTSHLVNWREIFVVSLFSNFSEETPHSRAIEPLKKNDRKLWAGADKVDNDGHYEHSSAGRIALVKASI